MFAGAGTAVLAASVKVEGAAVVVDTLVADLKRQRFQAANTAFGYGSRPRLPL